MALLGFLGKKRSTKDLKPPAPGPGQAAESTAAPAPETSQPSPSHSADESSPQKSPVQTPAPQPKPEQKENAVDTGGAEKLPPLTLGQDIDHWEPPKERHDMPPAFDLDADKQEHAGDPSVNPPTAFVKAEPKLNDLPSFDEMHGPSDMDEHELPSFEVPPGLQKVGEGITAEQKQKLEEVLKTAPEGKIPAPAENKISSDFVSMTPVQKEEYVAQELHDIPQDMEDPHKLITYDHDISHTAEAGESKVKAMPPAFDDVQTTEDAGLKDEHLDSMKQEVEKELDQQVSKFTLEELELKRKKAKESAGQSEVASMLGAGEKDNSKPSKPPAKTAAPPKEEKPKSSAQEKTQIRELAKKGPKEDVVPMDTLKHDDLMSRKKYYLQTKPIFVFIDKYRYMLDKLHESKASLKTMETVSQSVFELNKNQDILHKKMTETLEKVQESLIYVDHTIFEDR